MKKLFFLLAFVLFSFQFSHAKKHALIIAVGDYPSKTGWGAISSLNDVALIKQSLLNQNFLESDIIVLTNENATKQGITAALMALQSKLQPGDIVVVHYSGHGQQIFDDNGEEPDDLDEALVPYDAFVKYTHNYKGENHLRDDELANVIANFRNKLGKNGQLLFILDSCHSGSATRGAKTRGGKSAFVPDGWETNKKQVKKGSEMFEGVKLSDDAASFVMISGASADELNYEYDGYGSLSFAFSKAMNELGSDFTYRQLFSKIATNMNIISPNQTPTIEGDVDYKLFKGEIVAQQPYFEVIKIGRQNTVSVNAGKLNRLFTGTTVFIMPAGSTKANADKALATGIITNATYNESTIQLDKPLKSNNRKEYWVFVDKPSYGDIAVNVYIDKPVTDAAVISGVKSFLEKNALGKIVSDTLAADVWIVKEGNKYGLRASRGLSAIDEVASSRGDAVEQITSKLFNYAQGQYLKNLSLQNEDYQFEFKLLPIEHDAASRTTSAFKPEGSNINASGIFEVGTVNDHVVLQVTNNGTKPVYFSIIEINSMGEIAPFMPNPNCKQNDNERMIAPGKTVVYKDCIFSFSPPYERLILKGFATSTPINFQPTVATRGEGTRGPANPLEKFIQKTYTRGSGASSSNEAIDGYSSEFVYEIVRK